MTIVRPRTILGHGRLGIFGILFDWIADGADVFVLGNGANRYQFVHADDLAELCLRAAGRSGPGLFNAGTDRFGTMRETLESVCAHAGTGVSRALAARRAGLAAMRAAAGLHVAPFAPYHWIMYSKSMWFDIEHAREQLGWQPRWSNEEMFVQSYDWFLANRATAGGPGGAGCRWCERRRSRTLPPPPVGTAGRAPRPQARHPPAPPLTPPPPDCRSPDAPAFAHFRARRVPFREPERTGSAARSGHG